MAWTKSRTIRPANRVYLVKYLRQHLVFDEDQFSIHIHRFPLWDDIQYALQGKSPPSNTSQRLYTSNYQGTSTRWTAWVWSFLDPRDTVHILHEQTRQRRCFTLHLTLHAIYRSPSAWDFVKDVSRAGSPALEALGAAPLPVAAGDFQAPLALVLEEEMCSLMFIVHAELSHAWRSGIVPAPIRRIEVEIAVGRVPHRRGGAHESEAVRTDDHGICRSRCGECESGSESRGKVETHFGVYWVPRAEVDVEQVCCEV